MSEKHLAAGSSCPPTTNGLLRIYSMKYCPFAQRTLIVLNAKNVKHEIVNINLQSKPEWFLKINPLGKVPTLQLHGKPICESMITSDYLDETYPSPPLYPSDPWDKGVDRCLIEIFGAKVLGPFYSVYTISRDDNEKVKSAAENVRKELKFFEEELGRRGTKYFGGKSPGMLDYAIYPWFERFPVIEKILPEFKAFDEASFPKLYAFAEALKKDPAVQASAPSFDDHVKFIISAFDKKHEYDIE